MTTNGSGFEATQYFVLVKQKKTEEKVGNILLPDEHKTRKQFAEQTGIVVSIGELAFTRGTPGKADYHVSLVKPKIGSKVIFDQYAGSRFTGMDQENYIFLSDTQIFGVNTDE